MWTGLVKEEWEKNPALEKENKGKLARFASSLDVIRYLRGIHLSFVTVYHIFLSSFLSFFLCLALSSWGNGVGNDKVVVSMIFCGRQTLTLPQAWVAIQYDQTSYAGTIIFIESTKHGKYTILIFFSCSFKLKASFIYLLSFHFFIL